jgi:hypothetical protein
MATFNDQLKNNRLKTLSLDVLDQASGIGQRWDTYGVSVADITTPNFWDVSQRPLQTNDVIAVTLHDSTYDRARLGSFRALAGYARRIEGDRYASRLLKLNWGDDFCTFDIENISQYAGTTQVFPLGYHATLQPVMFYVFVDSESIKGGSVVLKAGSTTITTVALTAGDSFGKMYSYDASAKAPASTYSISFTGAAGETSTGNIHVVMVSNYQLPAEE